MTKSWKTLGSTLFFISSIIFLLYSCTTPAPVAETQKTPPAAFMTKTPQQLSIMAMNVENLFDTQHDEGKDDYAYLPKSAKTTASHINYCESLKNNRYRDECLNLDWNDEVLKIKMQNLSQVVLDLDGGIGPDILMLSEVENERVLKQWRDGYLKNANYKTLVLLEGADPRGIDVGLLSRLELARAPELVPISSEYLPATDQARAKSLRGFLVVPLKADKSVINVIVGHLPSQANPHSQRVAAMMTLKLIIEKIENKKELFIAGGDFNITHEENKESGLFSKTASSFSLVSHLIGCQKCQGSHSYRGEWSFLDVLMFPKSFAVDSNSASKQASSLWKLDVNSIDVIRYNPVHLRNDQTPKRFDEENRSGVSDHFPIYARIYRN